MLTDFQRKKLPKMFALNDNNGDGVITQEDFEVALRSLARFQGVEAGTPAYEEMSRTIMARWDNLRATCDADGDNRVTLEEWLNHWDKVLATDGEYDRVGRPFSAVVARTLDLDGDGRISPAEYAEWIGRWGVDEQAALACFVHLDLNGDGYLSQEEFVTLVAQFFQSSDPTSPGNWLLGPIDEQLSSGESAQG